MRIAIGNDHAAVELKKVIKEYVESMGHEVVNFGNRELLLQNAPSQDEGMFRIPKVLN